VGGVEIIALARILKLHLDIVTFAFGLRGVAHPIEDHLLLIGAAGLTQTMLARATLTATGLTATARRCFRRGLSHSLRGFSGRSRGG
jgi:SpoVK/Ycf46/Vps4 family AAA+-type ATPase